MVALFVMVNIISGCGMGGAQPADTKSISSSTEQVAGDPAEKSTVSYPITIEHAFGQSVIEKEPERVVAIAQGNGDVSLALGVVPVGISRANYGNFVVSDTGLFPWTETAYQQLGDENPNVFDDTDGLNFEAINNAKPDVILAAFSGITQEDYNLLTQIAPVVAYPELAWGANWKDQIVLNAKGLGKEAEGKELLSRTEELIHKKMTVDPALLNKKSAFIFIRTKYLGKLYVYLPTNPRYDYLIDIGLSVPEGIQQLAKETQGFTATVSAENVDLLKDAELIVTYGDPAFLEVLQADSLIGQIPAISNGAVALLDDSTALAASAQPSVLSIPAHIDEYLGLLSKAAEKAQ